MPLFKRASPRTSKSQPRASPVPNAPASVRALNKRERWSLDKPLLHLSAADVWTTRDACEGVQVFGGIGGGKTSGSGKAIAHSFLRSGFGGLVLCAKPEEKSLWLQYTHETGRESQVIVFNPLEKSRYNFIDAELRRSTATGGGLTENIVELLTTVSALAEGTKGMDTGDKFFERSMKVILRNAIEVITIAKGRITLDDICRFVIEAPQSEEQVADEEWRTSSFTAQCIAEADAKPKTAREQHDCDISIRYWLTSWPTMADRTRSSIVATWESVGDLLLHGIAFDLLSTETNWLPELSFQGAITIVDLPLQRFHQVGRIIQGVLKYAWQRAVLARDVEEHPRPVFLWADESQNFVSAFDYEYQSTARSARACTVYLTQSISNYTARLGSGAQAQADALLGLFQTTVFHANSDGMTNEWASKRIGQHWTTTHSFSSNSNAGGGSGSRSSSGSESVQYKILPSAFTTLRKGGPANNLEVDAIVFQGGRVWNATGETYLQTTFKQG